MSNVSELLGVPGLGDDLTLVEARLATSVAVADPYLSDVAGHLLQAGGKRWRPLLATAAARAGGRSVSEDVLWGGAAVELVHLGSLYHDDVIDQADTRRGVPSVNARWSNLVAVLAGDFLLAKASEIAAGLGTEIAGLLAATIGRMCQGQVLELRDGFSLDRTEDAYLASIDGKTASLLSTSARVGALTAGLDRAAVEAFTAFGHCVGVVFQICDDILDVIGTEEELGKPAGNDIVEGVYTLPVLRALRDSEAGPELRELLGRPVDAPTMEKARDIVRATDGVAQAVVVAREWADRAAAAAAPVAGDTGLASSGHRLIGTLPL
ncbi:MAG TPA: polyprenyl synthetase family protein [Acidimicrobiales bacterium]|nr:polyprenyl synthetase family protein [Acidimicrobiales bacterium]